METSVGQSAEVARVHTRLLNDMATSLESVAVSNAALALAFNQFGRHIVGWINNPPREGEEEERVIEDWDDIGPTAEEWHDKLRYDPRIKPEARDRILDLEDELRAERARIRELEAELAERENGEGGEEDEVEVVERPRKRRVPPGWTDDEEEQVAGGSGLTNAEKEAASSEGPEGERMEVDVEAQGTGGAETAPTA
jgi:hypothetical protein